MRRALVPTLLAAGALAAGTIVPAAASQPASTPQAAQAKPVATAAQTSYRPDQAHQRFRGNLVKVRKLRNAAALDGAKNYKLWYLSVGAQGQPIVVTGTVAIPKGHAPRHGFRVLSWAHGTTGVADACAPSKDTATGPSHDDLEAWIDHGYAVVQTDYEGLGTPGVHPYINGTSEANTVIDMIRAARSFDHRIGRQWVAAGHSQGGQAALFTAAAPRGPRNVKPLGSIALAPGGVGISQIVHFATTPGPAQAASIAFMPAIMLGAAAADPAIVLGDLLTDNGWHAISPGYHLCLAQSAAAAAAVDPTTVFKPGADFSKLTSYLLSQEPQFLTVKVPTLVLQGTADMAVAKSGTDYLVSQLQANSSVPVTYKTYEGADHRGVLSASIDAQLQFANKLYRQHRHHR